MDIGSLTGQVALEDQLSDKLTIITSHVKEFANSFDGMTGAVVVGAGAIAAAMTGAVISIVALGEKGSTILGVEDAFDKLAKAAGSTGEEMIGALTEGVRGTIDSMELMQSTTRLLSSGLKVGNDDLRLMAQTAREMGKATGTDAAAGLNILSGAMLTGNARSLKRYGIQLDLVAAEKEFRQSIGNTSDKLTAEGKLEVNRIAVLEGMRVKMDALGESSLSFKERVQQVTVSVGDWFDSLAKGVASSPNVLRAFDAISDAITKTFGGGSQALLDWVLKWVNRFANAVATYGPPAIEMIGKIRDYIYRVWKTVTEAWDLVPDWFKNIAKEAGTTAGAIYLTSKAMGMLAAPTPESWVGTIASFATITSGLRDFVTVAIEAGPKAITQLKGIGMALQTVYLLGSMAGGGILGGMTAVFQSMGTAIMGIVATPLFAVAAAITAIGVAYKVGQLNDVQDWFEKMELYAEGMSMADAAAAVAQHRATDAAASVPHVNGHDINLATPQSPKPPKPPNYTESPGAAEANAIKKLAESLSPNLTVEVTRLDAAMSLLERTGKLTAPAINKVADSAAKLYMEGGKLTPALAKMPATQKAIAAALDNLRPKLEVVSGLFDNFFTILGKQTPGTASYIDKILGVAQAAQVRDLSAAMAELEKSGLLVGDHWRIAAKEAAALANAGANLTAELWNMAIASGELSSQHIERGLPSDFFSTLGKEVDIAVPKLRQTVDVIGELANGFVALGQVGGASFGPLMQGLGALFNQLKMGQGVYQQYRDSVVEAHGAAAGAAVKDFGVATPLFDSNASAGERWAAGIASAGVIASGAMNVWAASANDASKAAGAFHGAMSGAEAGAAFGPWGVAIGAATGVLLGFIHTLSAGRREVKDFAASFGSFDALHEKLLSSLGDDVGERFWVRLTQQIKKGDKAGALLIEKQITDSIANAPSTLAAAAGYQTRDDLQKIADKAKAVYDYMVSSGKYTAAAIADAFQKSKDATIAAMGDEGKAHADAMDAITAKYATMFDKIDSEYKTLSTSVANEAEEAVMGSVEIEERARMKKLEGERAALEEKKKAEELTANETYNAWVAAGHTADEELRKIFAKGYTAKLTIENENLPGGATSSGAPTGSSPSPQPLPTPTPAPFHGGGIINNTIELDGEVIGRKTAPYIAGELRTQGV